MYPLHEEADKRGCTASETLRSSTAALGNDHLGKIMSAMSTSGKVTQVY